VQSKQAVILAGGLGSRLGPITAQRSKALVTIGQRPHLIHQLLLLRDAGVQSVAVVVSPDTYNQVVDVVRRSGVDADLGIAYPVQRQPLGPANALLCGLEVLSDDAGVFMLMSDSFIDEPLLVDAVYGEGDWVGVAPAPSTRSFCYEENDIYLDGSVEAGRYVTVGVNYFASAGDARNCAALVASSERAAKFDEIPMSEFFNAYTDLRGPVMQRTLETWLDVGDVDALARAHRTRFISRSHHKLDLHVSGVLRKVGDGELFERQIKWLLERQTHGVPAIANLTPRVYDAWWGGPDSSGYLMEYVDLPTLAELWLYWPGRPDVWQTMLRNVLTQLKDNLWIGPDEDEPTANVLWFVDKTRDRLAMRGRPEWHAVAEPLLDSAEEHLRHWPGTLVRGHGDLNFSNILYSLNTGMIKLIDPRGDHLVPFLYELAKLRYSYHGGFTAITHGLASLGRIMGTVDVWPQRQAEVDALDDVLDQYCDMETLQVCEGCILIAGAPLHDGHEAELLFWRGVQLLHEVLGD
jgi:GTP:adenosylcobinamide-phosphate guanylyltransferase